MFCSLITIGMKEILFLFWLETSMNYGENMAEAVVDKLLAEAKYELEDLKKKIAMLESRNILLEDEKKSCINDVRSLLVFLGNWYANFYCLFYVLFINM